MVLIHRLARRWKDSVGLEPTTRTSFTVAEEQVTTTVVESEVLVQHVEPSCMAAGRKIIDGTSWGLFIVVLALITLFLDDFEVLLFTWKLQHTDVYGRICYKNLESNSVSTARRGIHFSSFVWNIHSWFEDDKQ